MSAVVSIGGIRIRLRSTLAGGPREIADTEGRMRMNGCKTCVVVCKNGETRRHNRKAQHWGGRLFCKLTAPDSIREEEN